MFKKKNTASKELNIAQRLLQFIGGTASLVAGVDDHWWSDSQTAKKGHKRPLLNRGDFGKNIMAAYDLRGIEWSSKRFKPV